MKRLTKNHKNYLFAKVQLYNSEAGMGCTNRSTCVGGGNNCTNKTTCGK